MLIVLKGWHPRDGELCNEFTIKEKDLAIHVGKAWLRRGWFPCLFIKSWDGRFVWLTSEFGQKKAA